MNMYRTLFNFNFIHIKIDPYNDIEIRALIYKNRISLSKFPISHY